MLSRRIYCVSLAAGVLVCPRAAQAQTQKPVAQLRESQVEVGEEAVLEVVVPLDSPNADVGQPNVRGPKGLRVRSLGTSLSQRMVQDNGRVSMSIMRSFSYSLSADQPGKYPLAIEMRLGDKRQKITPAPELVVTKEARRPAQPEIQDDADQRVIIELSKHEVYVGEPILYSCEIWDRGGGQLGMEKAPTFRDFWVEDLAPGQQRMERGDFGSFFVIPIRRAIISPQKTGKLTLASPAFVVQQSRFGSPRLRGRPRQHRLVGKEQVIEVKPLPSAGQPPDFVANNVGHFELEATVDRQEIKAGEGFSVSYRLSGTGNLRFVEFGQLAKIDGAKQYEAKLGDPVLAAEGGTLTGERTLTQLVVATRSGILEVPAMRVPYFDPETESYGVATSKVIAVSVLPGANAVEGEESAAADKSAADELDAQAPALAQSLRPVTQWRADDRVPEIAAAADQHAFVGQWAMIPIVGSSLGLAAWGILKWLDHPTRRARVREQAETQRALTQLEASVEQPDAFYSRAAQFAQQLLLRRTGPQGEGLARDRLLRLAKERGLSSELCEKVRTLLDAADAARFGGTAAKGDSAQKQHLDALKELVEETDLGRSP